MTAALDLYYVPPPSLTVDAKSEQSAVGGSIPTPPGTTGHSVNQHTLLCPVVERPLTQVIASPISNESLMPL